MSRRNRVLAGLGILALTLYVLACQPAFSPNGKEVLFPALDPELEQASVWRCHLRTGKAHPILKVAAQTGRDGPALMAVAWAPDGERAAVAWAGDETRMNVAVLPLVERGTALFFEIPCEKDEDGQIAGVVYPPQFVGSRLFVSGQPATRIDLRTGEVEPVVPSKPEGDKPAEVMYLSGRGGRLFYMTEDEGQVEIGRLDPETLARSRLWRHEAKEGSFFAPSKDGTRIAIAEKGEGTYRVRIHGGPAGEEAALELGEGVSELGNLAWSSDEKQLYAPAVRKAAADESAASLVVLEIPVNGEAVRDIPIGPLKGEREQVLTTQVALSPNGRTLAISTAFCYDKEMGRGDRALYLVDLRSQSRKVRRIPVPWGL